jgi:hypothetical protein
LYVAPSALNEPAGQVRNVPRPPPQSTNARPYRPQQQRPQHQQSQSQPPQQQPQFAPTGRGYSRGGYVPQNGYQRPPPQR